MYNVYTYARVCNDEDSEDERTAQQLLREAAGPPPPPVAPSVVTSTSALSSRSQQAVQQRRGGGSSFKTTIAVEQAPAAAPSTSAQVSNLIDLGDDAGPGPGSTVARVSNNKTRGKAAPAQQVELVTLMPTDPFELLVQQTAQQPPPPTYTGSPPEAPGPGGGGGGAIARPSHPLDFGFFGAGPDDAPRASVGGAAAAAAPAAANGGGGGGGLSYPRDSFSDLLFGSSTTAAPAAAATQQQQHHHQQPPHLSHAGVWGSFSTMPPPAGGAAGPSASAASASAAASGLPNGLARANYRHSQSTNGIDDLLQQQREEREAAASGPGPEPGSGPGPSAPSASADGAQPPGPAPSASGASFVPGSGGGDGYSMNQRELLLYAIPLFKDRLVFLPVVNWTDEPDTSTVLGKVNAGVQSMQSSMSNMWHSLKDKGKLPSKIYHAGQAILENMNAEERLMRNIPRRANKLVVHHPAAIPPDEVQDQLTALTASFCYKSVGKAAVAGVMLPVAVGLEVIAVPGVGWYTAYQLFKSTSAAAGGSRLNNYLKSDKSEVRVCYAPTPKMDLYILKSRLSPDGVLGGEEIEDLCHDLKEPALLHALTELRTRHLKKTQTMNADYALLPMSTPDVDEQYGNVPDKKKN